MGIDMERWADSRETSMAVAVAIFELAGGDENKAQKIWEDGYESDLVEALAFSYADDEGELYWGEAVLSRKKAGLKPS